MISAVSENLINNDYCHYLWTVDHFTLIIVPSEDRNDFCDRTGLLIKSLGFGD